MPFAPLKDIENYYIIEQMKTLFPSEELLIIQKMSSLKAKLMPAVVT